MWSSTEERWHYCGKTNNSYSTHSSPNATKFSSAVAQKIKKEKGFFYLQQSLVSVLALMARRAAKTGKRQWLCVCVLFFPLWALLLTQPQQVTCVCRCVVKARGQIWCQGLLLHPGVLKSMTEGIWTHARLTRWCTAQHAEQFVDGARLRF